MPCVHTRTPVLNRYSAGTPVPQLSRTILRQRSRRYFAVRAPLRLFRFWAYPLSQVTKLSRSAPWLSRKNGSNDF